MLLLNLQTSFSILQLATPTGTTPVSTTTPSSAPFQSQLWAPPNLVDTPTPLHIAHCSLIPSNSSYQALSSSTSQNNSIKRLVESQRRKPIAILSSSHQSLASHKPVPRKLPKMPHPPPPPPCTTTPTFSTFQTPSSSPVRDGSASSSTSIYYWNLAETAWQY